MLRKSSASNVWAVNFENGNFSPNSEKVTKLSKF